MKINYRTLLTMAIAAASIVAATAAREKGSAFRLYIEAEDCAGLLRYPYNHEEADGWYALEACARGNLGAPGRTYCAAIHENASENNRAMRYPLAQPIPAGRYKVFLRAHAHDPQPEESVLKVSLGKKDVEFKWGKEKTRWKWLEGVEINVDEPIATVSFTAIKFGGNRNCRFYNPLRNTLWIDTLYITDALNEKSPPEIEQERAVRSGISPEDMPARQTYWVDQDGPGGDTGTTPEPLRKAEAGPTPLESFDGRKNLWPNSSLELGMNDGWMGGRVFSEEDLDSRKPFHGKYSLRVPKSTTFSRPYYLSDGGEMTLSVYVRGGEGKIGIHLMRWEGWKTGKLAGLLATKAVLSVEGAGRDEWQRLVVTGRIDSGWYYLSVSGESEFWLDAIQLERGATASEYAPRAEVEGALRSGQLANVIYEDQDYLEVWIHNSSPKKQEASLRYRIVDVREAVAAEGVTKALNVAPGETIKEKVAMKPKARGMFSVSYALEPRRMPEGELVYLHMPRPSEKPTRHQLGANMSANEVCFAVHSRAGFQWALTCKTREFGAASEHVKPTRETWKTPEKWTWYDDRAALAGKYHMNIFPCFWPDRVPEFMVTDYTKQPNRGRCKRTNESGRWKEYVTAVAGHYKDYFKVWCLEDETEGSDAAEHMAELVNVTSDALRQGVPGVQLGISAYPSFQEEMFQYVDPAKLDWLGGSNFDFDYWEARKVRRMSERWHKPTACFGVGGRPPEVTMYHTLYTYKPVVYSRAARMARRMINTILIQDLSIVGHYASIIANYGNHLNLNKPLLDYDGTPLPWGGTFSCVGTLLADAELVADIPLLGDRDRRAYVFKTGKELGAVTWATCRRTANHWWRPAERVLKGFTLSCPEGSVEVLDMYWNKKAATWREGAVSIDLNEEPSFIMDRGLGQAKFIEMLKQATAPLPAVRAEMRFIGSAKEGIELEVKVRNDSSERLKGVTLDLRFPKTGCAPWSVAGAWLLKRPYAEIGDIEAGGEKAVRLATNLKGDTPYEVGQMRAYLRSQDGQETAVDDCLWMLPSVKMGKGPGIDGGLEEWLSRSAGWLYYSLIWNQLGRYVLQWDDGAEYFSYPPYRLDARGRLWSGWDKDYLYVAMSLEDDQPILGKGKGETMRVVIRAAGGKRMEVQVRPEAGGGVEVSGVEGAKAKSRVTERKGLNGEDAKMETLKAVDMELAIPWAGLGIKPEANHVLGFDLFWTDVDREEEEVVGGTMRWAGGARDTGYMFLKE